METVEVYPPSPNWFQASCCAVVHGVLAYAARERVVLMDVATGHVVRQLGGGDGVLPAAAARVAAVALAEHSGRLVAACAHENGAVRLWDARAGTVLLCGAATAATPLTSCALCTTTARADASAAPAAAVIVAGDTHGRLSFWHYTGVPGVTPDQQQQQQQQQQGAARHTAVLCTNAAVAVVRACPCDTRYFAAVAANGVAALFFVRTVGAPAELCRFAAFDGTCAVQDAQWARDPATGALLLAVSVRDRVCVFQVDALLSTPREHDSSPAAALEVASSSVVTVKELATVRVPHAPQQQAQQQGQQKGARQWAPVAWARCGRGAAAALALLSCDARGTIAAWVVDAAHARLAPAPAALVRFVAGVHTRPVFSLVAAVLPGTARTVAVSAGMDRTLALWDCATGRRLWAVATLGGYVYALESSPLEPRRVYFAVGDCTIHAWNLPASCIAAGSGTASGTASHATSGAPAAPATLYEGRTLWKGLQAKVTSLALHPLLPGVLAYGLDDGRSGVYDVAAGSARPMKGSQKGAVYALAWQCAAPDDGCSSSNAAHTLWSAAVDGTLFAHLGADVPRGSSTTATAVPLETLVEHSAWFQGLGAAERAEQRATLLARHSTVAASADGALLCVGNKSGLVCVLARGCVPVRQTRLHTQPVARARWSPVHTHVCATCSDDGTVQVLDAASSAEAPRLLRGGHRGAVYDVAWAPAAAPNTRVLASAGADGAVLLWDTRAGTCLGALRRPGTAPAATLAVHWPAALPACILCGGVDQAVRVCRVDIGACNGGAPGGVSTSEEAATNISSSSSMRPVITPPPAVLAACRVVASGVKRPPPSPPPEAEAEKAAQPQPKPPPAKSCPSSSSSEEADVELFSTADTRTEAEVLAACSALVDVPGDSASATETTSGTAIPAATATASLVSALTRAKQHSEVLAAIDAATAERGGSDAAQTHVLVLEGDLPALAARCGAPGHRVSALELALLPALGRAVWAAGVALYAAQQEAAGHAAAAATCLAALGRVPAAVDVLLRAHAHAAALALQAARAPADTALRGRVLAAWAAHHAHAGRHLRAAECYAAAGFARSAAACLEQTLVVPGALVDPALRPRVEALLARLRSAVPDPSLTPLSDASDAVVPAPPPPSSAGNTDTTTTTD